MSKRNIISEFFFFFCLLISSRPFVHGQAKPYVETIPQITDPVLIDNYWTYADCPSGPCPEYTKFADLWFKCPELEI